MKKIVKNNTLNIALVIFAILALIAIRAFESVLFYDPFISFFKSEYFHKTIPSYNSIQLFLFLLLRYGLNSIASIFIIYLLFKDKSTFRLSVYLYIGIGIILFILFFLFLMMYERPDFLTLFYIRRFIIQPVLLVLFVPAFYYQNKIK